ncbi:hypothetical protein NLJ89_g8128 [Agrocybe chaxingu]|uniref:Uncharacterized protein n=1 Tax=Agrocybe chaxingu TaxID=84603 RepID=A0A9W8JVB1_9AGAR|nr:hypothetical protein NLJ89_g8128 [Agrocybe chaxingu]
MNSQSSSPRKRGRSPSPVAPPPDAIPIDPTQCGDPRCVRDSCCRGISTSVFVYTDLVPTGPGIQCHEDLKRVAPFIWKLYCTKNDIVLRQHRHFWHMIGGDAEGHRYLIYVPTTNTWNSFNPSDVIQVTFPGYIIM